MRANIPLGFLVCKVKVRILMNNNVLGGLTTVTNPEPLYRTISIIQHLLVLLLLYATNLISQYRAQLHMLPNHLNTGSLKIPNQPILPV